MNTKKRKRVNFVASNIKRISTSLIIIILSILTIIMVGMIVYSVNAVAALKQEMKTIEDKVDIANSFVYNTENTEYSHYILLSDNAKAEMDRLVTTVGVLATIYTIFGALIVFRAPHEIDKKISNLDNWVSEAKESGETAKYLAEINEALTISTEAEFTNYCKIRSITKIIDKYPNRPEAYIQRGFIYDKMKKYDEAISDYRIANKLGYNDASIFSNIGVAYDKKKEYAKAEYYYTKAINKDPNDADYYINRGGCYDDMHDYEKALEDYNEAIKIDPEERDAYINRALTYESMKEEAAAETEKTYYHEKLIDDLKKALEIDPDHKKTKRLLEKNVRDEKTIFEYFAKIYERYADQNIDNPTKAMTSYIDAFESWYLYYTEGNKDSIKGLFNLINKMYSIAPDDVKKVIEKTAESKVFTIGLKDIGIKAYEEGDHLIAEKTFILLVKYAPESKSGCLNLAYMKRRGETELTELTVQELIEKSKPEQEGDAIWCTNKALCHVSSIEGFEQSLTKAVEVIKTITKNIDDAIQWWNNSDLVGEKENNMVMLLYALGSINHEIETDTSIEERKEAARKAGYYVDD